MSLNWQWDDKMGEVIYDNGERNTLYQGNALTIAVHHTDDGCYSLVWFAADKEHLRNLLGTAKGHENVMQHWGIRTIRLNTHYRSVPGIVSEFAKAKMPITVELFQDDGKGA
jgi:hypothetical protein